MNKFIKFVGKAIYYLSVIPPIVNTIKEYLTTSKELAEQLKMLNNAIKMEEQFNEDNSDD